MNISANEALLNNDVLDWNDVDLDFALPPLDETTLMQLSAAESGNAQQGPYSTNNTQQLLSQNPWMDQQSFPLTITQHQLSSSSQATDNSGFNIDPHQNFLELVEMPEHSEVMVESSLAKLVN